MFWSILHRSIFWELLRVFLLALVGLTGMVLLAGIVAEASQRGLGPGQLLVAIPLIIPSTMPYTVPATTLFATCLVYGRLAADNEILAIKAAGVNVLRVVWPGVLLGLITSVTTFALYYYVIPTSQYTLRVRFMKDVEELLYTMLNQDRCINHPRLNYAIWVEKVQGKLLMGVTFKRRDKQGNFDLVARAREGDLRVDTHNEKVLFHMRFGEVITVKDGVNVLFVDRIWEVPLQNTNDETRKAREMTWPQLGQRCQELTQELEDIAAGHATAISQSMMRALPDTLPQHLDNLSKKRKFKKRDLAIVEVEGHMRIVLAAGCFCFVLVGAPVGIWFSKSDYLSAFVTCFLPVVFVYYPLMLCGINVARSGRFPMVVCMWPCNVLMALVAVVLLRKLMRN